MKKFALSLLLLAIVAIGNAQLQSPFKPFKVDLSLGYAIPGGTGAKGGVLFALELKYEVIPNLSVGLRMEGAVMARGTVDANGKRGRCRRKSCRILFCLPVIIISTQSTVRPFAGTWLWVFIRWQPPLLNTNGTTAAGGAGSKFGEMVR